ncbi:BCAS3 microtubule associated cell migration factor-like isoform X2 [Schistocerca gregaria]|uniref:BCAS3 microtubule associated cell migration factor-like isoform X2 n=1 Tax=Schistocerca gregaria TaxID=7010 RepID=UPI00211F16CC|nr:BCAS3 microtubule associated cell migration factor-like isoform X2 [Schistocerca gregaria]
MQKASSGLVKVAEPVLLSRRSENPLTRVIDKAAGIIEGVNDWIWEKSTEKAKLKDVITFACFQDVSFSYDICIPCLLVGYNNGFQVWDVSANKGSTITEIASKQWKCVKFIRAIELPDPGYRDQTESDPYADNRPLLAAVSCVGTTKNPSKILSLLGLRNNTWMHPLEFPNSITDVRSNRYVVIVGTCDSMLYLLNSCTLELINQIACWKDHNPLSGPAFALGGHWLAFQTRTARKGLYTRGSESSVSGERKAEMSRKEDNNIWSKQEMLGMANYSMKEAVYAGSKMLHSLRSVYVSGFSPPSVSQNDSVPGMVEIVEVESFCTIALWQAGHKKISMMDFDASGLLLVTAPDGGQNVKLWSACTFIQNPMSQPIPLYTLERGTTLGDITHVTFNENSTLLAFTSKPKGTTHIFPILPEGGEADANSHLSSKKTGLERVKGHQKTFRPVKLATIHSNTVSNDVFAGISKISALPNQSVTSDEDGENVHCDYGCFTFHADGGLIRRDLHLRRDSSVSSVLVGDVYPKLRWDLTRTLGSPESFNVDYLFRPASPHAVDGDLDGAHPPYDVESILSNVEMITHAKDGEFWWRSDMFSLFAYVVPPTWPKDMDKSTKWRCDSIYTETPKRQLEVRSNLEKKLVQNQCCSQNDADFHTTLKTASKDLLNVNLSSEPKDSGYRASGTRSGNSSSNSGAYSDYTDTNSSEASEENFLIDQFFGVAGNSSNSSGDHKCEDDNTDSHNNRHATNDGDYGTENNGVNKAANSNSDSQSLNCTKANLLKRRSSNNAKSAVANSNKKAR